MGRNGWSRRAIIALMSYFVHSTGNSFTFVPQYNFAEDFALCGWLYTGF